MKDEPRDVAPADEADSGERATPEESDEAERDVIVDDYRTILTELSLLTTVSVLLFGFLLAVAIREDLSTAQDWLLFVALILVSSATMIFVLPVVYHRLEFPYQDWDKFQVRTHGFISLGFPLFVAGLYASLSLSIWNLVQIWSLAVAAVPIAVAGLIFVGRRRISTQTSDEEEASGDA